MFQFTKAYFQNTKAYFQSTKVYCQSTKSILSKYTFNVQECTFKLQKDTFNVQKHNFKVQKYTFKVQEYTFEVQSNCRKPWPGTFLIPRVPGTRFPETVPSKPLKQNLPRNLRNLFHATFWTGTLEPQNLSEPIETRSGSQNWFPEPVPGTRFLPGIAPARPEHTEIYIVQRPHSILLLGKKHIWVGEILFKIMKLLTQRKLLRFFLMKLPWTFYVKDFRWPLLLHLWD